MTRHESHLIRLAISVLEEAPPAQTPAVQLALRVLLPYANKTDLMGLWQSAGTANPLVRDSGWHAAMGGIRKWARSEGIA